VEIRSLDVNAFDPLGVNESQLYFLEIFVLFCLLQDSPALTSMDMNEIDMNLVQVAHAGRQPDLKLLCCDLPILLKDWALNLCEAMQGIADVLDRVNHCQSYTDSLKKQIECIKNPELTPSARMLNEMRNRNEGFFHYARRMSLQHIEHFRSQQLSKEREQLFEQAAKDSLIKQKQIEFADEVDFDEYLHQYFSQS
jgi:glutamate--cysteine ligase